MHGLALEWQEADQIRTQKIFVRNNNLYPNIVRLGRQVDCDIVFSEYDLKISRRHAEIFFKLQDSNFYLRKIPQATRSPVIDNKVLYSGEAILKQGCMIMLGQTIINIIRVFSPSEASLICSNIQCPNPNKNRVVNAKYLLSGCPWCGISLAEAETFYPQGFYIRPIDL
ncbi:FHA domain-containing protein [Aetokthonos hydrillicola Thurmond2011]|jgi:predicted component of type VI protein secretion system|uniref:FHA domain-containing protein n=1 Tax=Aetokthonos hydrillicola Thurmond2011 TaxID=2712845 RepID=A0AAP5I7H7_9CYAN|nr:FHA domain-containing protein [Aetokthonos hydrillicola]MBO3458211.1 FHA domain-containing protein [Aetokthonos hydrillicola CCALA 1050]MBW4584431.1 FHA domain-containing protein [Aetokthonos hydrillicola CCALA 1050]MDR9896392.1 FHA domain-containing protein [Aetokthonos hydrillicola Thurmond2011]